MIIIKIIKIIIIIAIIKIIMIITTIIIIMIIIRCLTLDRAQQETQWMLSLLTFASTQFASVEKKGLSDG